MRKDRAQTRHGAWRRSDCINDLLTVAERPWKRPARDGKPGKAKNRRAMAVSREYHEHVNNLVGMSGDHPVRLKYYSVTDSAVSTVKDKVKRNPGGQ